MSPPFRTLLLLCIAGCDACESPPDPVCDGGWCFDMDLFGDGIADALDGNTVGWAYVVYQDGKATQFDSGGMRRTAADPPAQTMSIFDRVNVASVTKTLVTVATLDALTRHGVGLDDSIADHLPPTWSPHVSIDSISFRELLSQKSGLPGTGTDLDCLYTGMQAQLEIGFDTSLNGAYNYQNINFCLLRAILPALEGAPFVGLSFIDDASTQAVFFDTLQTHLFDPAGIADVRGRSEAPDPTLYYGHPDPGWSGYDTGDEEAIAGGGTLHLSMLELAKVIWMVDQTSDILDATQLAEMRSAGSDNVGLGVYAQSVTGGTAWHHNGGLDYWWGNWSESLPAGTRSVHYTFPDGIVAALTFTGIGTVTDPNKVMVDAYENAWIPEVSP
ncbi:MAG: beta-lactamase family protein [Myxococcales bacterium]|nr:beta-lactamase family protein [Myxococcales bacterium]